MNTALKTARTRLTVLTVAVAILCALLSVVGTYIIAEQQLQQKINAAHIGQLAESSPELSEYLQSQEKYHAHFEAIATIIQNEDRRQLVSTLPIVFGAVFLVSGFIGWLLAQRLLKPVDEAYNMQRRFMQDAAHELRNPLAAMKSVIQHINQPNTSSKKMKQGLESLERQTNHLTEMTTDLLLLEKAEQAVPKKNELIALTQDVIESMQHRINEERVNVLVDAPNKLLAPIDPQHYVTILKNILENAVKFSDGKNKTVTITLQKIKNGWILSVTNHGPVIKQSEIHKLTRRFYRGSNSKTIEGTGLGLAIVAKYIQLYKGNLKITSDKKTGTVVSARF